MTIKPTYLFYDLETSGLNPCFDQVMQWAAIRTDLELNEIERYEWFVQLKPENIANPYAMITHGITPKQCKDGKHDYASLQDIHQLFNTPGTLSGGYNTLGFDDSFLRFGFYRHLLTPYTHQFKNNCGRFDLYPVAILYYLYSPIDIVWPINDGKISMKLEDLNAANGLAQGSAHEAMCDVKATLALAKLFKQDAKQFNYAMGFFDKKIDSQRTHQIHTNLTIALEGKIGARHQFQALVTPLGQHQHYKNQSCWLCLDQIDFESIEPNNLTQETRCIKKRAGEPPFLLPALDRFLEKMGSDKIVLAKKNLDWLQAHPKKAQLLKDHYLHEKYPVIEEADCYAKLYQTGFANHHDENLMQQFHQASPANKTSLTTCFNNSIYNQLAERICDLTTPAVQKYKDQRFGLIEPAPIDYKGQPALTLPHAMYLCKEILNEPHKISEEKRIMCDDYLNYLNELQLSLLPTIKS
jgi:exodeoxyribonuclease-1